MWGHTHALQSEHLFQLEISSFCMLVTKKVVLAVSESLPNLELSGGSSQESVINNWSDDLSSCSIIFKDCVQCAY